MKRFSSFILLTFLFTCLLAISACSEPPQLPLARPLTITEQQKQQIANNDKGQFNIASKRDIEFTAKNGNDEHTLLLNVYYPKEGEHYPLVLFSHGNWSSKEKYDNVINHWVSHGYVVIAPNHADCCSMASGIFNSLRYGNFGLIEKRITDFNLLLNNLDVLVTEIPEISGKIDTSNIAAAGHSFGAFTAQQFGGAGTFNTDTNKYHYYLDKRIKAVIALSPPGPMFDEITKDSWKKLTTPMLITTGTWDIDSHFFPQWQLHRMSFDTAIEGDKYALVTQGADHYLGNLICRPEREQAPQQDALTMLNATTTSFLNTYLKQTNKDAMVNGFNNLKTLTNDFSTIVSK